MTSDYVYNAFMSSDAITGDKNEPVFVKTFLPWLPPCDHDECGPTGCGLDNKSMRQTGVTTEQMKKAPEGATYVWPNTHLHYPRRLAEHLGRHDLVIVSAGSVRRETVEGSRISLVVDHATRWTDGIFEAEAYLRGVELSYPLRTASKCMAS